MARQPKRISPEMAARLSALEKSRIVAAAFSSLLFQFVDLERAELEITKKETEKPPEPFACSDDDAAAGGACEDDWRGF